LFSHFEPIGGSKKFKSIDWDCSWNAMWTPKILPAGWWNLFWTRFSLNNGEFWPSLISIESTSSFVRLRLNPEHIPLSVRNEMIVVNLDLSVRRFLFLWNWRSRSHVAVDTHSAYSILGKGSSRERHPWLIPRLEWLKISFFFNIKGLRFRKREGWRETCVAVAAEFVLPSPLSIIWPFGTRMRTLFRHIPSGVIHVMASGSKTENGLGCWIDPIGQASRSYLFIPFQDPKVN